MTTNKRSAGTLQTARLKQPWNANRPFRILSIDGGGIRGILPAQILSEMEAETMSGRPIATGFDMIAGTSTGGIIAIGLSLGIPARAILDLYLTRGDKIFPSAPWPFKSLATRFKRIRQIFGSIYDPDVLDHELAKLLGGHKFGDANSRMVIPALDHNTEPYIFKTPHHPDYKKDWSEDALTVARATSAAPTFFEGVSHAGRRFWDGGIFANNPVMMAVVDVLACYDIQPQNIEILSLGCATNAPKLTKKHLKSGLWGWRNAHSVASCLQSHDALGQAGLLIGRHHLTRIDTGLLDPMEMDDYHSASRILPEIGKRLYAEHQNELSKFGTERTSNYEPIYPNRPVAIFG